MDIKYGLAGVIADQTAVSKVMPETNSLTYRGYAVQDLVSQCSFEEVAYLLIKGKLPDAKELQDFCELEKQKRLLSPELAQLLTYLPAKAHPMDIVRSAVSFMGAEDHSKENNYEKAVGLLATVLFVSGITLETAVWSAMTPASPYLISINTWAIGCNYLRFYCGIINNAR